MSAPLLLRDILFHRFRLQNFRPSVAGIFVNVAPHCLFCSAPTVPVSGRPDRKASYATQISNIPDDFDDGEWKDKAKEIIKDIDPIVRMAKDILHLGRYMVGEQLTDEDEKLVVEKLLSHHPYYEDKIGCGLESIMFRPRMIYSYDTELYYVENDEIPATVALPNRVLSSVSNRNKI